MMIVTKEEIVSRGNSFPLLGNWALVGTMRTGESPAGTPTSDISPTNCYSYTIYNSLLQHWNISHQYMCLQCFFFIHKDRLFQFCPTVFSEVLSLIQILWREETKTRKEFTKEKVGMWQQIWVCQILVPLLRWLLWNEMHLLRNYDWALGR